MPLAAVFGRAGDRVVERLGNTDDWAERLDLVAAARRPVTYPLATARRVFYLVTFVQWSPIGLLIPVIVLIMTL